MNIYLIGYRATGKTTVGQKLAQKLGRRFVDADQYLESMAKMTVSKIVATYGWDEFRRREMEGIALLSDMKDIVAATGGGAVLNSENIQTLKRTGRIIWLQADAETIISRMEKDHKTKTLRPPLLNDAASAADEVKKTLAHRMPLYQKASHATINTDKKSVTEICDQILQYLLKEALSISPGENKPDCHP